MNETTFLKRVLLLDAASCLGMGAVLTLGAGSLAGPFGLSATILTGAGLALLPIGLFIAFVASRAMSHPALVWLIVGGNALWVGDSILLMTQAPNITMIGSAFVAVQAAAVAALTLLEAWGVTRMRAARA